MTNRRFAFATLCALSTAAACGGTKTRFPGCGFAMLAGPTVIQQQLNDARAVLTEMPRGLPGQLPARVAGQGSQGNVLVGYDESRHPVLGYQGIGFPMAGAGGYGLLVMDDTSQRVQGVVIYESPAPRGYPEIGKVTSGGGDVTLPLFGVRVDWSGVSNPRCPLLGDTARATR